MNKYTIIATNETITVPKGKCWNGYPVNRMNDEQLLAIGLSKYVAPVQPPYVPTIEESATSLVTQKWQEILEAGYTNTAGITMQCDKKDYEMMRDGLQVFLDAPLELGGAGGNLQATTAVRDKVNNPHYMTVELARQLATEMMQYYWQQWFYKGKYIDELRLCASVEEMKLVVWGV